MTHRLAVVGLVILSCTQLFAQQLLPVPPILEPVSRGAGGTVYELTAQQTQTEFFPGTATRTLGYSQAYLGPTIRADRGETVLVRVTNELEESTTVHWHGLHVPAESDGGPHQRIDPGTTWTARFTVDQSAATLWYHPHPVGRTGVQVYNGLAGIMILEDEYSRSLPLPSTYGVDDIPLVVQDRRFDSDGQFLYARSMPEVMHGFSGSVLLANGARDAVFHAPSGVIRLRILNASDMNVMRFRFSDDRSFMHIATDGGLLSAPLESSEITLATGERAEILVNASSRSSSTSASSFALMADDMYGNSSPVVVLEVDPDRMAPYRTLSDLPPAFRPLPAVTVPRGTRTRRFVMSSMGPGGQLTINGRRMDMNRVEFSIPLEQTEIWEISNTGRGMMSVPHTFHIHAGQYRLIDVNGAPPPVAVDGRKDTWLLWPGDTLRVLVSFSDYTGLYMYHCHFLVHEDFGMMGQFEVVPRE